MRQKPTPPSSGVAMDHATVFGATQRQQAMQSIKRPAQQPPAPKPPK